MSEKLNLTPITELHELCLKEGWVPKYVLTAYEGYDHVPLFVFNVTAGNICATGIGPSKKKAKHNAALNAVEILRNLNQQKNFSDINNEDDSSEKISELNLYSKHNEDNQGNPVGELQESTQKVAWNPPKYEFSDAQGPPHDKEFICKVQVCNHIEKASGKSKKLAKRNAASLMLEQIKKGLVHNNNPLQDDAQFMMENSKQNFIQSQHQPNPIIHHNEDNSYPQNTHPTETKPQQKKISAMFSNSTKSTKMGKYLSELLKINFTNTTDEEDSNNEFDNNYYENYANQYSSHFNNSSNENGYKNIESYGYGIRNYEKNNVNNKNNNDDEISKKNEQTLEGSGKIYKNKIFEYISDSRSSQQTPLEKYWSEATQKNTKEKAKVKNQLESKKVINSNEANAKTTHQPPPNEGNIQKSSKSSTTNTQNASKNEKKRCKKQTRNEVVDEVSGYHYDTMMNMLDNLAKEQAFEFMFFDLPVSSTEGDFQSLIHLTTTPPQTAHGSGKSKYEARKKACHNVLMKLQILTKRPT